MASVTCIWSWAQLLVEAPLNVFTQHHGAKLISNPRQEWYLTVADTTTDGSGMPTEILEICFLVHYRTHILSGRKCTWNSFCFIDMVFADNV